MCVYNKNMGSINKELTRDKERDVSRWLAECGKRRDLERGKALHIHAVELGCHKDKYVANALIKMYSKCGCIHHARDVFHSVEHKDVVLWNALILGYVENGESLSALELYTRMECEKTSFTYVAALKACACVCCLEKGMDIHREAKERGMDMNIYVANTLIDMYGKCRCMYHARYVFDTMKIRTVVSWASLILGYVENGESLFAMELFVNMDCVPNGVCFVAVFKACIGLATKDRQFSLNKGLVFHAQARERGVDGDVFVASTLVEMYGKCGSVRHAKGVFDNMKSRNVVAWNSLIMGYVENGESSVATELYTRMDCEPSSFTFVAALKACHNLGDRELCLQRGMDVHTRAKEYCFDTDIYVGNSLMEMYSKCSSMGHAWDVFNKMKHRDVVSWNTLLMGYVENGESSICMDLFTSMDVKPDYVTLLALLKACMSLTSLSLGKEVHAHINKLGYELNQVLANCLVEFYGKSGSLGGAEDLFCIMRSPDIVSWNALISGYVAQGESLRVFNMVHYISESGLRMDNGTFMLILTCCNHSGMVEEGIHCFEYMYKYGLSPSIEHYTCVVDMLGRANRLEDAFMLVKNIPVDTDSVVWRSLLSSCREGSNVEGVTAAFGALAAFKKEADFISFLMACNS